MSKFLSKEEARHQIWARTRKHLTQRLARLREENDEPADSADITFRQGRIAEIKELLTANDYTSVPFRGIDYDAVPGETE